MGRFFKVHQHVFKKDKGWDPNVYPTLGERLLRCPGSVKQVGQTRALLPLESRPGRTTPVRFFLVQYLTGDEVLLLKHVLPPNNVAPARATAAPTGTFHLQRLQPSVQVLHDLIAALDAKEVSEAALLQAIETIVGAECAEWPTPQRASFLCAHMEYRDRFKVVLFLLHHGVSQENCLLWMLKRSALHNLEAKLHAAKLTEEFSDLSNKRWEQYSTFCMASKSMVRVRCCTCKHVE